MYLPSADVLLQETSASSKTQQIQGDMCLVLGAFHEMCIIHTSVRINKYVSTACLVLPLYESAVTDMHLLTRQKYDRSPRKIQ